MKIVDIVLSHEGENPVRVLLNAEKSQDFKKLQEEYQKLVLSLSGLEKTLPSNYRKKSRAPKSLQDLNLTRDYFLESRNPVLFWVSTGLLSEIPVMSPDFWRARTKVLEFQPSFEVIKQSMRQLADLPMFVKDVEDIKRRVRITKRILRGLNLGLHKDKYDYISHANTLGNLYHRLGENAKAKRLYEESKAIAEDLGYEQGLSDSLHQLGLLAKDLGDYAQALFYYEQSLPISRDVGDRAGEAITLNNIGGAYSDLGQNETALEYYEQSLPIRREVGDRQGEATTLNNIGLVYSDLGQTETALECYEQALPILSGVGDRRGEATTLNNIGGAYSDLDRKDEALEYYEQSLSIRREVGDRRGEATTLNNIGGVYNDLGKQETALEYFERILPIRREVGDRTGEAVTLSNIAFIFADQGRLADAVSFMERVVEIDKEIRHPDLEQDRAELEDFRQRLQEQEGGSQ
ncbi:MAG: tetratricopeptide repeat protein [Nitrospinae bacterium]|nr:tetratricopeptide repeat protein [Nitrospinota bacterium]